MLKIKFVIQYCMENGLPDRSDLAAENVPKLTINSSPHFANWLQTQGISLAFSTYQTNRLFFIGCNNQGRIAAHERLFDKPMGMYAINNSLYASTRYQIWRFDNVLAPGERYQQSDRLYIPRTAYTTGDLNVHDVVIDYIPSGHCLPHLVVDLNLRTNP